MSAGDPVAFVLTPDERRAIARENELMAELARANNEIGALLFCLKEACRAQLHPRSVISLMLIDQIRRHEPGWAP